jgi:hypothetical protein
MPTVLFSQNKPAPVISHQPNEQAEIICNGGSMIYFFVLEFLSPFYY